MDALSADCLYGIVKKSFSGLKDSVGKTPTYSLPDVLLSGLAIFGQKYPSLLAFENDLAISNAKADNLKKLVGIEKIPSDTQMRERIDRIDQNELRVAFLDVHKYARDNGAYDKFDYNGKFLLAVDGTGFYSSNSVSCDHCMSKKRSSGETSYEHQALAVVMVHPDQEQVLPLAPEFISNQDGQTKNDTERNAAKRLLAKTRSENPDLPIVVIEDGLSSNAPHIELLKELKMGFILGAKPGDHKFLFESLQKARLEGNIDSLILNKDGIKYEVEILNETRLNGSSTILVNFLLVKVTNKKGKTTIFSWVTDQILSRESWYDVMRAGRCRWKIENETFNTLKNQGYNFEHNYGHGYQNLCNNFGTLMFLQFLLDQLMELGWVLFQEVRNLYSSRAAIWNHIRTLFFLLPFSNWKNLFLILCGKLQVAIVANEPNTC